MTLREQGFRFTLRVDPVTGERDWNWRHPAEVTDADMDCTDMTDDEYADFVLRQIWEVTA